MCWVLCLLNILDVCARMLTLSLFVSVCDDSVLFLCGCVLFFCVCVCVCVIDGVCVILFHSFVSQRKIQPSLNKNIHPSFLLGRKSKTKNQIGYWKHGSWCEFVIFFYVFVKHYIFRKRNFFSFFEISLLPPSPSDFEIHQEQIAQVLPTFLPWQ